jgi:hypothetical protein
VVSEAVVWLVEAASVRSQHGTWTLKEKRKRTSQDEKWTYREEKFLMLMLT